MHVFSTVSYSRRNPEICLALSNTSIPYSAESHGISTDASNNIAMRYVIISVRNNSISIQTHAGKNFFFLHEASQLFTRQNRSNEIYVWESF